MFYPVTVKEGEARAVVALTPAQGKRLIARGVAAMPEVKQALARGRVVVSRGSTNAFVAEELLGVSVDKANYMAGCVVRGQLRDTDASIRLRPYVIVGGKISTTPMAQVISELAANDVVIKGANAVDPQGNAGVLVASLAGGTMGEVMVPALARGCPFITPVGLEKLIPSVAEAARASGILRFRWSDGLAVGLIPLVSSLVVTEIQALGLLFGVKATHIASGGVGGSEGAVVLSLEGEERAVERAFDLAKSLDSEEPVPLPSALSEVKRYS